MNLNDYSNTDFNSKKKPLVGTGTPPLSNLATNPAQTSAPTNTPSLSKGIPSLANLSANPSPPVPSQSSLSQSPISASQSPIQKPVLSNLSAPTKLVGAPETPQSFSRTLTPSPKPTTGVIGVGRAGQQPVPDEKIGVSRASPNGFANPAYTDYMNARQPVLSATPKLAGTQPLRNIQVPPESAMDVKNMSLGQMANRQSLVGSKKSVEQMMATTTLPPAPMGTQAAMSPVNSPNRITAALNDPNNYHDHLMQLSKDAGVTKFQPNLDYSADMNAMPKKLAGTSQINQIPTSDKPKLAGTFNGENVYKNDNGSITLSNGKTLNDNNRLAAAREVLPAYAIDKLRNEALYNHDPNALDALVKVNAGNQTHQQVAENLGFERDKFDKTNELARQTQDANQRYNQGVLDNQNRQTALQESSAQWERAKPSQKLDDIKNNLHIALIDAAKSGDTDRFEQVANAFKKYHVTTVDSKKEKLKTSYKDAMGNEVENEHLVDGDKVSTPEETRAWVDQMAQSMQPKDDNRTLRK